MQGKTLEGGTASHELADELATARLAQDVAAVLRPGDLVALSGGLGAGKSSFARALIRAAADDPDREVPSPTFPIRIDHTLSRFTIVHCDLYRIESAGDLEEIGLDEALADGAVLVEWPELLPSGLTPNRLDVGFEMHGSGRRVQLTGAGSWLERLARTAAVRRFLHEAGWGDATRVPLAGDASSRAYERASRPGDRAILMDAAARPEGPPIYAGRSYDAVAHRALDVRAFVAIGRQLRKAGCRAPEIRAADIGQGLLLLEDLGGEGVLDEAGTPVIERYEAAVDLLAFMHGQDWPEDLLLPDGSSFRVPPYDHEALLVEISLFPDWFGGKTGEPAFPPGARDEFLQAWSEVLDHLDRSETALVLRDFHSPNILWQAEAAGTDRVGIIDFQDALIGHPAYDVASLAQDARAPLTEAQEQALKARYVAARRAQGRPFDEAAFDAAYAILAAQRATKVLGAFTRLALAEGKPGYQRYRQRLKSLLRRTLAHPVLSDLRLWYEPYI